MAHLSSSNFGQEVVGESYYIKTLARCFQAGKQDKSSKRSYTTVRLVAENDNKHDKNAVAVVSEFGKVGHLSRADAKLYRKLYGSDETHTTDAVIVTRDDALFGVWLDICLNECETNDFLDAQSKSSLSNNPTNIPVEHPIVLEPKQPPPPPKAWKEQSLGERMVTILALGFLIGCVYLVFVTLRWLFGLF